MAKCRHLLILCFISGLAAAQSPRTYTVSEAAAQEIVSAVLKSSPVIDGHNDLFVHYFDCKDCPKDLANYRIDIINSGHTDIPRLRKGGVGAVLLNVFGREKSMESYMQGWDLLYRLEATHRNDLKLVGTSTEMKEVMSQGKIAILPSLEGATRLGNNMYQLRSFYKLGLRSVTFAYQTNHLADGNDDDPKFDGISGFGKEMVKEMNRLGVLIDMSHISAKAMNGILDVTKAPVIFSHSNARALCDVTRNVPDDVLKRLKQNNGIIMLTPVPYFTHEDHNRWLNSGDSLYGVLLRRNLQNAKDTAALDMEFKQWEKTHPQPPVTVADFADHFDYVKKLIGVSHIGIAGDYDGIEYYIKGMEDISSYPKLLAELARRGWTQDELSQVTGGNFLRVFEEVERKAAQLQKEMSPSLAVYKHDKN